VVLDYIIVAIFGGVIGSTELLTRYRDAPFKALWSLHAGSYIFLNVFASIGALWLTRLFGVTFGLDASTEVEKLRWAQVFVAGFGAMILFRSSLFVLSMGDKTMSVGPSSILEALLEILDGAVDRERAQDRATSIEKVMEGVSFRKAKDVLPVVTFALMQNLPRENQDLVLNRVLDLESKRKNKELSDSAAAYALGLSLMDIVGENVLRDAIDLIKDDVSVEPQPVGEEPKPFEELFADAAEEAKISVDDKKTKD